MFNKTHTQIAIRIINLILLTVSTLIVLYNQALANPLPDSQLTINLVNLGSEDPIMARLTDQNGVTYTVSTSQTLSLEFGVYTFTIESMTPTYYNDWITCDQDGTQQDSDIDNDTFIVFLQLNQDVMCNLGFKGESPAQSKSTVYLPLIVGGMDNSTNQANQAILAIDLDSQLATFVLIQDESTSNLYTVTSDRSEYIVEPGQHTYSIQSEYTVEAVYCGDSVDSILYKDNLFTIVIPQSTVGCTIVLTE